MVGETLLVMGEDGLHNFTLAGRENTILNLDLDFFAPEMSSVDFELARRFVDRYRSSASLITVATSPFFIHQQRAITYLRKLAGI